MVSAVLFDFGRVLGNFDKMKACQIFELRGSKMTTKEIHDHIVGSRLEIGLESGKISGTAFATNLLGRIGSPLTVPDVLRIWGNIFSPNLVIDPYVEKLIQEGVKIGVLSNTNAIHWPFIQDLPVMGLLARYGARNTLSHEVRSMKPHPLIYKRALAHMQLPAPEILYIDDLKENVDAARSLGMEAEEYDCTKHTKERLQQIFKAYHLL